jgi:hypothetical protein
MRLPLSQNYEDVVTPRCLKENLSDRDYPARLDIRYKAFKDDVKYAKQYRNVHKERTEAIPTHAVLNRSKHRICEDYELECTSTWRGNVLQEYKRESLEEDRERRSRESQTSFEEDREKCCEDFETSFEKVSKKRYEESQTSWEKHREMRYKVWLNIHKRAIYALEGHFRQNSFSNNIDIRGMLRDLWCFLPQEFSRCGTDFELQKRHVQWITGRTDVSRRNEINEFLNDLVVNFCKQDQGALATRIGLFEGDSDSTPKQYDLLRKDMLASGAYAFLVKRLLLQTPLLFWPAVFKPGVSRYFEENTKPSEVYYSFDGELVVHCSNTRWDSGYEVSILWARLLEYQESEHISRCSRAHEYRFSLNFSPSKSKKNWGRVKSSTN